MNARIDWGTLLQERLDRIGMPQAHLARLMRVDRTAVRNWVAGSNSCKGVNSLADILFPDAGGTDPEKREFIRKHDEAFAYTHKPKLPPGSSSKQPPVTPPPPPDPEDEGEGGFRLGDIAARMLVLDHARSGYRYGEFRSSLVLWEEPPMPEDWRERWSKAADKAEGLRRDGHINDNSIVALRDVKPRREGVGEPSGFEMTFSTMSYVAKRTATIFFNEFLIPAERATLLEDVRGWRLHPILSRCLNTQVAVITSDSKFMFARRSGHVINPGKTVCGVAETMEEGDRIAPDGRGGPDVFSAALRGLVQEFGIDLGDAPDNPHDVIKLVSLSFDMDFYEPIFIGIADFREASGVLRQQATARNIEDGLRTGRAKDKWENKDVTFVDFRLQPLFDHVVKHPLASYATVCLVQALQFAGFSDERIVEEHRQSARRTSCE